MLAKLAWPYFLTKKFMPSDSDLLRLDKQFCFSLYSASLAMTKAYKPLLAKIGLTYPQYLVMLVLWQQDNVLVKDIGEALFLDSGTLTPLLKRMESAAFISRQRDTEDERQVRITLTANGKALKEAAKEIPVQLLCASGQSADTLMQLRSQLTQIRDDLSTSA
ncbi:MarR family transcriptional regulator [Iodobacter sp. LRB]|uniref:MarR family winged helix-turn-helix transcriptional regulator n=1 Tax=unclassified Iodobacter TaxID=235634 RepID=UPI002679FE02|nr:MarR family transcriptional regulator [Iodobacter sp. BJB302]